MFESLHTHTTSSDGHLSHEEMFRLANELGVRVIAFTDHDALIPERALSYLESIRGKSLKWISGIEISASLPKEAGGGMKGGLHMIGLFVDPKNEALMKHCSLAQKHRVERMEKIVGNLKKLGFNVSEEDCLKASGGESVGRPHIVQAIHSHPENDAVTKKIIDEMSRESDLVLKAKYEAMMAQGEYQYPYELYLSENSYKKAYVENEYAPDMDEAATLIRNAGGAAFIAHYFTVAKKLSPELIRKFLEEKRIDGMETVYGLWHIGKPDGGQLAREKLTVREFIKNTGALEAGGPDAHTEEDMRIFASNADFHSPTAGMSEKILRAGFGSKSSTSLII